MARQRWVYGASFLGVLLLPLPIHWLLALAGVDALGALVFLIQIGAWRLVAGVGSDSFADQHDALVYAVAILLYLVAYFALSVPAHRLTRARPRLHVWVLALVVVGYLILIWFAFPIRGVAI